MWGERTALSVSYRTFQKSLDVGGFVWRVADRTTDNFLLRPVRRPFERLSDGLHKDAAARIDEGRIVERRGRVLAEQTVNDIVSDFMDYLSENPDLVDLISDSGMGLAGNVMDNGRQIGAVTDTACRKYDPQVFRRPNARNCRLHPLMAFRRPCTIPSTRLALTKPRPRVNDEHSRTQSAEEKRRHQ